MTRDTDDERARTPRVDVEILALGGIGEPGTPPIAPASAHAVHAAGGERVGRPPLAASGCPPAS